MCSFHPSAMPQLQPSSRRLTARRHASIFRCAPRTGVGGKSGQGWSGAATRGLMATLFRHESVYLTMSFASLSFFPGHRSDLVHRHMQSHRRRIEQAKGKRASSIHLLDIHFSHVCFVARVDISCSSQGAVILH